LKTVTLSIEKFVTFDVIKDLREDIVGKANATDFKIM